MTKQEWTSGALTIANGGHGQPKWIKCSDRMPDEYIDVLACGEEGIIIAKYYGEDCGGWATSMNKSSDNITHWQPLPEPPENE